MKPRGAMIQGALALVGLGAAWATWQREPERAASDVVVLDAARSDIRRVRFEDDKGWVELYRNDDDGAVWMKVSAKTDSKDDKPEAKPDPHKPPKPPEPAHPERDLRAAEAATKLLDSFGPLRVSRALGAIDNAKLKEFGLAQADAPDGGVAPAWKKRRVEVQLRGDKRAFLVGSPHGSSATYLKDERDGRVYLAAGTLISDLESAATRMVERQMHKFKPTEFDEVIVEAGGKRRELTVGEGGKFHAKRSPDKPDETAKNWSDRVLRLSAVDTLGKGEQPASGAPTVAAKVTYRSKGKELGWIELGKTTPALPATQPEYYARTEFTPSWVKVSAGPAEESLKEADKIATE